MHPNSNKTEDRVQSLFLSRPHSVTCQQLHLMMEIPLHESNDVERWKAEGCSACEEKNFYLEKKWSFECAKDD